MSEGRQCSGKWRVDQPTSEVRREPSIFVVKILVNKPNRSFAERTAPPHFYSIVPGGFDVMSQVTRLIPRTLR
jgi:hypothetical protein